MTRNEIQERRQVALAALMRKHHVEIDTNRPAETQRNSGLEDLYPYFVGETPIGQFAAVTTTGAGQDPDITYILPWHPTLRSAMTRASEYMQDDLYAEQPVEVVDLDTGQRWLPEINVEWRSV